MLATYASAVILLAASVTVGRAIWRAAGARETSWLEPLVGFGMLSIVASAAVRAFDGAGAASVAVGAVILVALVYLRGRIIDRRSLAVALPLLAAVLVVSAIPFAVSGRVGILGIGVNNDLASHLLWADWLNDQPGPAPVGVANGYPIGPHALAAVLGTTFGFSILHSITGLMIASVGLTAISSLAIFSKHPPFQRLVAGVLVALPYLSAAAFAVGGFKETVMAAYLLGFVLLLRRAEREWPPDRATVVSLGILPAAIMTAYSFPGLAWIVASAGLLASYGVFRALRAGRLAAELRRAAPAVLLSGAVFLVLAATEIVRARTFQDVSGVEVTFTSDSKLRAAVSPFESLGTWPSSDFLAGTTGLDAHIVFSLLGLLALVAALSTWFRFGGRALPLAVLGAAVIYLGTLIKGGLYVETKALAVPAPLLMAVILGGLIGGRARARAAGGAGPGFGDGAGRGRSTSILGSVPLRAALATAFVVVAAYSSFLALRDAVVAPNEHADELAVIGQRIGGGRVLSLTSDRFTDYQLDNVPVGNQVASPTPNALRVVPSRDGKESRLPLDFDAVDASTLDQFDWVLATRTEFRSAPPPNLELVGRTDSYELYRRTGPTPTNSLVLPERSRPGRMLICTELNPLAFKEARLDATSALVLKPRPVIGKRGFWKPDEFLRPGESATHTLNLPAGEWDISMQYQTPLNRLTVTAPGFSATALPAMDGAIIFRPGEGPFWRLGTLTSPGGPVTFRVEAGESSFVQGLLGADREAAAGNIAASRPGASRTVPIAEACGKYVDHYFVPLNRRTAN